MGQHQLSSQHGGRFSRFVLSLLIVGLLFGPAWGPVSLASPARQASVPPGGLGVVPSGPDKLSLVRPPARLAGGDEEELPANVDLTGEAILLAGQPSAAGVPAVGHQGTTQTCTGWATSYYYKTYQEWQEHQWSLSGEDGYEHIFSPNFVYNQITDGPDPACSKGAEISEAMELITTQGDLRWSQLPWNPSDCSIQPTAAEKTAAEVYDGINFGAFFITPDGGPPTGPSLHHDLTPLKQ